MAPQKWKKTGKEGDKYLKQGYIVPDRRYFFDFKLRLVKAGEEKVRTGYTRADTIKEAMNSLEAVAASLAKEEAWESYKIELAA